MATMNGQGSGLSVVRLESSKTRAGPRPLSQLDSRPGSVAAESDEAHPPSICGIQVPNPASRSRMGSHCFAQQSRLFCALRERLDSPPNHSQHGALKRSRPPPSQRLLRASQAPKNAADTAAIQEQHLELEHPVHGIKTQN
mmetsp:Transcript_17313/g.28833  ORF Transcript_17313/g.28833 Transcript_17313/m.28833 type:complete len:141 (+) Transcript_17313:531-953(+)